jgi:hypothetical protein
MATHTPISCHSPAHVSISRRRALPTAPSTALTASGGMCKDVRGSLPGKVDAILRVELRAREDAGVWCCVHRRGCTRSEREPLQAGNETLALGESPGPLLWTWRSRSGHVLRGGPPSALPRRAFQQNSSNRIVGSALQHALGVSHEHVHSPGPGIVGWPKARAEAPDCAVISVAASAMPSRLALAKVPSEVMVWLASGSISTGFQEKFLISTPSIHKEKSN